MELLGFSKWKSINESIDKLYYRFDFKDPSKDKEERAALVRKVLTRECEKLFPSYDADIVLDNYRIKITFTIKEDEFSLFSDTGTTKPLTLALDSTILAFTGIRQNTIRVFEYLAKVFKQPNGADQTQPVLVSISNTITIESFIDNSAKALQWRYPYISYSKLKDANIAVPTEDQLDEIIFNGRDTQKFNEVLGDYIGYLYFKEYINSALVGTQSPEVNTEKTIDSILAIKSEGKNISEAKEELTQIIPVLHKLYYESVYQRVESKEASELFAKAIVHLIEEFGNTEELFSVINKLVRTNNISNDSF